MGNLLAPLLRAKLKGSPSPSPSPAKQTEPVPEPVPAEFTEPETEPVALSVPVSSDIIETEEIVALEEHHVGIAKAPVFTTEQLARYAYEEIIRSGFSDVGPYSPEIALQLARGLKESLILDIGGKSVFLEANERGEIGYHYPFSTKLEVALRKFRQDTYGRLPEELKDEDNDLKSNAGTVLARFTKVTTGTVYDLTATQTFHNRLTRQYIKAPCPPRNLVPRFDPNIAEWLRLLSGDKHEKLLDWIATFSDLTKPTCALYLYGPTRAGKTLLPTGLNRYWTKDKKATPLWRYFDTFNNDVIRSGILLADEEVSPDRVKFTTTNLRDLITSETHDIFTKKQDSARAIGCFRIMMASNPSTMLDLDIRGLDPNSLEAVGLRFFPIEVDLKAKAFLEALGREGTEHWVDGDLIARHALFLRDTRKVTPGRHGLLVEGDMSASRDLLVATGPADVILGLLTDLLSGNTVLAGLEADTVFWGDNKLYVVMDKLRMYLDRSMKRPYPRKTLSNSLTNLQIANAPSDNRRRVWSHAATQIQSRVFDIDSAHLLNYMDQTQSGDRDKVTAALSKAICKGNGPFAPLGGTEEKNN